MIAWLRTALFSVVFYTGSIPIVLAAPVLALFGRRPLIRCSLFWFGFHRWATRTILGVKVRREGAMLPGSVIYAAKHQAMFETLELTLTLGEPAVVMKGELTRVPVWGWVAQRYGVIPVDREASAGALRRLMKDARAARDADRPILIFPEGTRVPVGETPPLRSGFAGLYRMLDRPVIPVALDSGVLIPRSGPKRAGTITFRFGEPIPPGLPRAEVERRVHAAINALENPS